MYYQQKLQKQDHLFMFLWCAHNFYGTINILNYKIKIYKTVNIE